MLSEAIAYDSTIISEFIVLRDHIDQGGFTRKCATRTVNKALQSRALFNLVMFIRITQMWTDASKSSNLTGAGVEKKNLKPFHNTR